MKTEIEAGIEECSEDSDEVSLFSGEGIPIFNIEERISNNQV